MSRKPRCSKCPNGFVASAFKSRSAGPKSNPHWCNSCAIIDVPLRCMPTMQTILGSTVSTMFYAQNWRGDETSQRAATRMVTTLFCLADQTRRIAPRKDSTVCCGSVRSRDETHRHMCRVACVADLAVPIDKNESAGAAGFLRQQGNSLVGG